MFLSALANTIIPLGLSPSSKDKFSFFKLTRQKLFSGQEVGGFDCPQSLLLPLLPLDKAKGRFFKTDTL